MSLDIWLALVALFFVGGLTPGPAVMLVLASSFRYGFRPAMLSALGIASANVLWLILAASGAAALAATFPQIFMGLKILGLLVICYLGFTTIFGPLPAANASAEDAPRRSRLYARGVALQLSSPMPLVFFGLLLPAYFDPAKAMAPQFTIMLVTVTILELFGLAVYAYGAQHIRIWLKSARAARGFNIMIGVVMILSGVFAVISTA